MKFFIDAHGCAKNQVDGEEIAARLEDMGHEYVSSGADAELIIVNTCGFIESAKKESIEAVMGIKAAWPNKKVLVAGCLAQRYPEELLSDLNEADGVFGNADLSRIGEATEKTLSGERTAIAPPQPEQIATSVYKRSRLFDFPGTAHVKITEGCGNRCTYCAIPLIRGDLRSRSLDDILDECRFLVEKGIFEINLIGQDLGSYGSDRLRGVPGSRAGSPELPRLLRALGTIKGDFRIRVLYIHPDHFPDELLAVMKDDPRILPYFDLPFQHASEKVLKAMNRKGSSSLYLDLVARIRSELSESMIRSTFLVGFPGETDEDFFALREFQEAASLDWLGAFTYSREDGTAAYSMKGRVSKKTAGQRKSDLENAQATITSTRLQRFLGKEAIILMEENMEGVPLTLGRGWMQAPEVDGLTVVKGSFIPGSRTRVRIVAVNGVDFEAEPLEG